MRKQAPLVAFVVSLAVSLSIAVTGRAADAGKTYKVFIYAGQSNAQGKAPIKIADAQAEAPATKSLYQHLRKDGKWIAYGE